MDEPSPPRRPPTTAALARFGSAPGSFLSTMIDGIVPTAPPARSRFFAGCSDSPCLTSESSAGMHGKPPKGAAGDLDLVLHGPYGHVGGAGPVDLAMNGGGGAAPSLIRHSSSPAGFLSHLMVDSGFSVSRAGEYPQEENHDIHGIGSRRLKPQLSFSSSRQDSISDLSIPVDGEDASTKRYVTPGFQISSWDEPNSIIFSAQSGKRGREGNSDIAAALSSLDSQYGLSRSTLDLENIENLFQIQQDSVPCKLRAKRGCATHPRSIAERERRTRISEKLKKLQELVPNMDKQTSTADMLDLAVQHIKGLQNQVQTLHQECAGCTCGSNNEIS